MDNLSLDITTKILKATFLNNMEAFKNILPDIYEYFIDYKSGDTLLTFDEQDNINLVDNGQLVYESDPKKSSIEQVEAFINDPKCFSYGLKFSENPYFEHEHILKKLTQRQIEETQELSNLQIEIPWNEPQLDFFCMIGCGLGYQIEEIFKRKDIKVFYLYEPSPDVFFAAMHCIDFKPLIDKCKSLGGSFTISVGGNEYSFANQINALLKANGFYLVSRMFVYRHYHSEENLNAFQLVHEIAHRYSAGWGFFEDEIISLVHTTENAEHEFPILNDDSLIENTMADVPVVIVGNGPSLDNDIQLLKARQGQVLIISCGTALKSLLHNGITPNVQIEMERTALLDEQYNLFSAKEHGILKTIPIIALNTVYSGLLQRFSQAYNMLKVNDAGTDLTCFLSSDNKFQVVKFCNPTVSNAAIMAMLHLGFNNVYMLGVDLGFVSEDHHHSKSSMYYQGEWEGKESEHKRFKTNNFSAKGNFRDEVFTTSIFDSSKASLEFAIVDFPEVNVFNCSDGVFIAGAEPLAFTDIKIEATMVDLHKDFLTLLDNSFSQSTKDKQYVHNFLEHEFFPKFKVVIEQFTAYMNEPIHSRTQLSDMFSRQNYYVYSLSLQANTMLYFRFLKGSMIYFQSTIMTNCAKYTDEKMRMSFIADSLYEMKEHFNFLYKDLLQGYDKPAKV